MPIIAKAPISRECAGRIEPDLRKSRKGLIMNRIIILALSGACAFGQVYHVNFSTSSPLDFSGGNGSFANDLYDNNGNFLEIGGLGNADSGGLILTPQFGPIDYTQGYGGFGDFRQTETITYEVPNPSYDPNRPIGPFNGPPTLERTSTIRTGELTGATFRLRAAPGIGSEPWRISIFDVDGDAYSFTITPTTAPGVFWTYNVPMEDESMPEMD